VKCLRCGYERGQPVGPCPRCGVPPVSKKTPLDRTLVGERPVMVSLLPAALALLVLLVLLLSLRFWIDSRMVSAARALATRTRTLAGARVPGPQPQPRGPVVGLPPAGAGGAYPSIGPLTSVIPGAPAPPGGVNVVERRTWVMVQTTPPDIETFVYVNGGSLLGRAPLRTAALMPGYHRLLFWAPAIRGRAVRTVYVQPETTTTVTADVRPAQWFWR